MQIKSRKVLKRIAQILKNTKQKKTRTKNFLKQVISSIILEIKTEKPLKFQDGAPCRVTEWTWRLIDGVVIAAEEGGWG